MGVCICVCTYCVSIRRCLCVLCVGVLCVGVRVCQDCRKTQHDLVDSGHKELNPFRILSFVVEHYQCKKPLKTIE